jgi:hypothetical protein
MDILAVLWANSAALSASRWPEDSLLYEATYDAAYAYAAAGDDDAGGYAASDAASDAAYAVHASKSTSESFVKALRRDVTHL